MLIRRGTAPIPRELPDGFEDLAAHNLLTFKSFQEALDEDTLWELIGHFVNYRKQSSPSFQNLFPVRDYRLFGVCARFPQGLAQRVPLTQLREGVFEIDCLGLKIRIIAVAQLPQHENNAMMHLFSAREELLRYGREHYRQRSSETSSVLLSLFETYSEDLEMSEKLKEFARQYLGEILNKMPLEQRLKGISPDDLRKQLPPEERLKGMSVEELLEAMSPEMRAALSQKLRANGTSAKPE